MSVETKVPGSFRDAILDARKATRDGKNLHINPCMGNGNGTKYCKDFDPGLGTLYKVSEGLLAMDGQLQCPEQRGRVVLNISDPIRPGKIRLLLNALKAKLPLVLGKT